MNIAITDLGNGRITRHSFSGPAICRAAGTPTVTHEGRKYMVVARDNGLVTVHMLTKTGWRILSGYGRGDRVKLAAQVIAKARGE